MDPALGGVPVRSTTTFGSFFTERSLTIGQLQLSLAATYQGVSFDEIDGRNLRDGTLRATASRLANQEPFDVETVTMRIHTDTVTVAANYGVTERLEVGAALPIERLTLTGERIDTNRGSPLLQATVSANASGAGDLVLRGKVNLLQRGAAGIAVDAEGRLPTGSSANLLGSGETTLKPRFIVSMETARVAVDSNVAYMFGGVSDELDYSAAVTNAGANKITDRGGAGRSSLEFSGTSNRRRHPSSRARRRRNNSAQRGRPADQQSGCRGRLQVECGSDMARDRERRPFVDQLGANGTMDVHRRRRVRFWRIGKWIRASPTRKATTRTSLTTSVAKSGSSNVPPRCIQFRKRRKS